MKLRCPLPRDRFDKDLQQLPVVGFERPLGPCSPRGLRAGGPANRIEQLAHAPGQVLVVVRVLRDEALTRWAEELAGAVVPRRDYRQATSESLQDDQRARVVKGGMHE